MMPVNMYIEIYFEKTTIYKIIFIAFCRSHRQHVSSNLEFLPFMVSEKHCLDMTDTEIGFKILFKPYSKFLSNSASFDF